MFIVFAAMVRWKLHFFFEFSGLSQFLIFVSRIACDFPSFFDLRRTSSLRGSTR
jgi:hypothetical protein